MALGGCEMSIIILIFTDDKLPAYLRLSEVICSILIDMSGSVYVKVGKVAGKLSTTTNSSDRLPEW